MSIAALVKRLVSHGAVKILRLDDERYHVEVRKHFVRGDDLEEVMRALLRMLEGR